MTRPGRPPVRWLPVVLGGSTVLAGVTALVWPQPAVRAAGLLFGANLLIVGAVRAVLLTFFARMYPFRHRVVGAVLGVLTAALGVLCLRHVGVSAALLALVLGAGWLFEGVLGARSGPAGEDDPLGGWRLVVGVAMVLAGLAVALWPAVRAADVVTIAGVFLIVIGVLEAGVAVRRRPAPAGWDDAR